MEGVRLVSSCALLTRALLTGSQAKGQDVEFEAATYGSVAPALGDDDNYAVPIPNAKPSLLELSREGLTRLSIEEVAALHPAGMPRGGPSTRAAVFTRRRVFFCVCVLLTRWAPSSRR